MSASSAGRTESRAIAAAAGALATGKPAGALAALLRAHQLKPADPVPLIDAAALMSDAGKGNEALAFLAAAQRLRLPRTHPFGIDWRAVIAANRGQALIVLHQYAQAQAALRSALRTAPLLTEADQNMAVAFDCQGKHASAQKFLVAGVARQAFPPTDYIEQTPGDPYGQLDPAEVLDITQGQQLTLENLKLPQSITEGHAMRLPLIQLSNQQPPLIGQANQQVSAEQTLLNSRLAHKSFATRQRTNEIEQAVAGASSELDIKPLADQALALRNRDQQPAEPDRRSSGLHGRWGIVGPLALASGRLRHGATQVR